MSLGHANVRDSARAQAALKFSFLTGVGKVRLGRFSKEKSFYPISDFTTCFSYLFRPFLKRGLLVHECFSLLSCSAGFCSALPQAVHFQIHRKVDHFLVETKLRKAL